MSLQDRLTFSLASINADIDYPEEDLEEQTNIDVSGVLCEVLTEVRSLIAKYPTGSKLKNGVKVAIVGKPNTGKSSILNALLNYEKAIVSSIAGTTRDVVEGSLSINGVNFDFYDTAGIRETKDVIEKLGIERSEKILKSADIVLLVLDSSNEITKEDKEILKSVSDKESVIVYNKADIKKVKESDGVQISAKTGEGLDELKEILYQKAFGKNVDLNGEFIVEERHYNALIRAEKALNDAINNISLVPMDLISEDIKTVWLYLGEITGKTASEEIIDEIFAKFCVGK